MKAKVIIFLLLFSGLTLVSHAQKLETAEDSIKKVINDETRYYATGQYEKWKELWVHSPKALHTGANNQSFHKRQSWESIHSSLKKYIQDTSNRVPPQELTIRRNNISIVRDGNMAFVYFISSDNIEPGAPITDKMEARVMQRVDGQWKLLYVNTIDISTYEQ